MLEYDGQYVQKEAFALYGLCGRPGLPGQAEFKQMEGFFLAHATQELSDFKSAFESVHEEIWEGCEANEACSCEREEGERGRYMVIGEKLAAGSEARVWRRDGEYGGVWIVMEHGEDDGEDGEDTRDGERTCCEECCGLAVL